MTNTTEMATRYDPSQVEDRLYRWWEARGYFRPEQQLASGLADPHKAPFVISMPPPNVTGALHMGHALTSALEDLMIRYHRMQGHPTLWVPGTDHAGIATQNVVERKLAAEGLSRQEIGREKFVAEVWKWKEAYHARITKQQRRLGVSCDWTRERFTLDNGLSRAVRTAFKQLYDKGLIYRGTYLVNWCPRCGSAISDLEVEHKEELGKLYTFRYPLADGNGYLPVATTRPETILGDTAVAVHPDDDRYKAYVGKEALVPMLNRHIPIIADAYVDREFGTGALKVTPAHDPNDYEIGKRHGLAFINILNEDGTLNENAGPYVGLTREAARRKLWEDMRAAGLVIGEEDYSHSVGHCQRCGTVIEPLLSTQWFVKIKPLAEPALAAVKEGRTQIIPRRFEKIYFNWLEGIRDWCISRQLWWGHRIPVWYCDDCGKETVAVETPQRCAHCGSDHIRQEEDVLDTWFSSGLWPFSTLGWPEETEDYRRYYPTSVLETGYDILFFWVARMMMMGIEMTGREPFHTVYLHGLIRDQHGKKMSKSSGNAMDPLEVIDLHGSDALRFTLLTGSTPGNDIKLSEEKLLANRNFANKIWNAARFVVSNLGEEPQQFDAIDGALLWEQPGLTAADRWILSRQHGLTERVTRLVDAYQFGEAGRELYDFLWGEYCDWYLEIAKIRLYGDDEAAKAVARRVLVYTLERTLRLLHPFMPFVTEEIWQHLPHSGEALMVTPWPAGGATDKAAEGRFALFQEVVRAIRNSRAEYNVPAGRKIKALLSAGEMADDLQSQRQLIARLANVDEAGLVIAEQVAAPGQTVTLVVTPVTIYLPLAGLIDLVAERARLQKALAGAEKEIARVAGLLSNENFRSKAPADVVAREKQRLAALEQKAAHLRQELEALQGNR